MWLTIGVTGGCLILIGGVIWLTFRLAYQKGKNEVKQDIAEDRALEMAIDANIASQPYPKRPLSDLLGKN